MATSEEIFADIETLDNRISKTKKLANNDKQAKIEYEILEKLKKHLEDGNLAITFETNSEDEANFVNSIGLLTAKGVIFAANVSEADIADDGAKNKYVASVKEYAKKTGSEVFCLCAKIEEDISALSDDEKKEFLEALNLKESGLDKLIKASYKLLNLMSFLTAGEKETRAWTIKVGTKAPAAAGKIHTDFERGFIRAEVISFDDLMACGSMAAAKEKGLVRSEGKDYVMKDGDIVLFRFNV